MAPHLIITQKVSNVSRTPDEIAFVSRILAAQKHPIGIYFVSEDLFTLASYYQEDLRDTELLVDKETGKLHLISTITFHVRTEETVRKADTTITTKA